MNGLALFAGIGGLELGLRLAIGSGYRTVCAVERDAFAAATLVARMDIAAMDRFPVWDDVCTFDGKPWRGRVDMVSAGFPCQPWSVAGKRKKTGDERWIWADVARVIRDVGPEYVFLENVPGLVGGGLEHVLWSLAALGFDAEWDLFAASDLGLPHKRERWFCLAHARCQCDDAGQSEPVSGGGDPAGAREVGATVANGNSDGFGRRPERDGEPIGSGDAQHWGDPERCDPDVADAHGGRSETDRARRNGSDRGGAIGSTLAAIAPTASQCGVALADADGGPIAHAERRPSGRAGARQAGETVLANTESRGVRCRSASNQSRLTAQSDESLAYTAGIGEREPDNEAYANPRGGDAWSLFGVGGHLVPPGPADREEWERIAAIAPGAQPALCRVADGSAGIVERPELRYRADRLRSLGNGVVPAVAALAFQTLRARLEDRDD